MLREASMARISETEIERLNHRRLKAAGSMAAPQGA
jgi:hypothetical protein